MGKAPKRLATFCGGKSPICRGVVGAGWMRNRLLVSRDIFVLRSVYTYYKTTLGRTLASKSRRTFSMKMRGGR